MVVDTMTTVSMVEFQNVVLVKELVKKENLNFYSKNQNKII
jgi:hypothetical protein